MIRDLETSVPKTARLPLDPPPWARPVYCPHCPRPVVLGVTADGLIWSRHHGRRQVSHLPARVECPKCRRGVTVEG